MYTLSHWFADSFDSLYDRANFLIYNNFESYRILLKIIWNFLNRVDGTPCTYIHVYEGNNERSEVSQAYLFRDCNNFIANLSSFLSSCVFLFLLPVLMSSTFHIRLNGTEWPVIEMMSRCFHKYSKNGARNAGRRQFRSKSLKSRWTSRNKLFLNDNKSFFITIDSWQWVEKANNVLRHQTFVYF